MTAPDLAPCPFCGPGESIVEAYKDDAGNWRVACGRCGVHTGFRPEITGDNTREHIVRHWNARPALSSPAPTDRERAKPTVEELQAILDAPDDGTPPKFSKPHAAFDNIKDALIDREVEAVAWAILQSLHENVADTERPMSWSDMDHDQEQRIRAAAVAAIEYLNQLRTPDRAAIRALLTTQPSKEGRPIETAPKDGTLIIASGGIAYWRDGGWWTLTAEEWPGKPIQWEVKRWWPVPHYQVGTIAKERI